MKSTKSSRLRSKELERLKSRVRERSKQCDVKIRQLCLHLDEPIDFYESNSSLSHSPTTSNDHDNYNDLLTIKMDAEAWFFRIAEQYNYTKDQLIERFYRGKYKEGASKRSYLPLDYVYHVLNDLEPTASDPLTPSMQKFLHEFVVKKQGEYVIDITSAINSLDIWKSPLKTKELSSSTSNDDYIGEENLLAELAQTLGYAGIHDFEEILHGEKEPFIHYKHVHSILQSLVMFNISLTTFYNVCLGFPMQDLLVDVRELILALRDYLRYRDNTPTPPVHDTLKQLQDLLAKHKVQYSTLLKQCSLFDFEDDGLISLSECISVLQSLPCVKLAAPELTKIFSPFLEINNMMRYPQLCQTLCLENKVSAAKVIPYNSQEHEQPKQNITWGSLRSKLYTDDATEKRVYEKVLAIFNKLTMDQRNISKSNIERVLGAHWSTTEIKWVHSQFHEEKENINIARFMACVFPNASFRTPAHHPHIMLRSPRKHKKKTIFEKLEQLHFSRNDIKSAFEAFASPHCSYLTPRQTISAIEELCAPMPFTGTELEELIVALDEKGLGQIRLNSFIDMFYHPKSSTFGKAPRFTTHEEINTPTNRSRTSSPKKHSTSPRRLSPERAKVNKLGISNRPLRADIADTVRRLRHAITTQKVELLKLLNEIDEGVGHSSVRSMTNLLWSIADQYTTIKYSAIESMVELLERHDGTIAIAETMDLIFDWAGLQNHLRTIATYSEVLELFQARDPHHKGHLVLCPDFQNAFYKIFRTKLQEWELYVMMSRFGVKVAGEACIDYKALIAFLLPRTAADIYDELIDRCVPGKSAGDAEIYRCFKKFDKEDKGYFDRKNLRRVLQEEFDIEPTSDQIDAIYRRFLPSPSDQVVRLQHFRQLASQRM
ncbi:hypothetical protein THRCLA_10043 [Thraustotheca clavata]|uniref:EF-hand domain-containing protein n=1 Tax=Thraustotheca clavata TaxID=74557 RepID=A0A1V9YSZ4_9STRA|nr:hypothetical protein THRCLA_10043 [Thraustotheca clavata]